MLQVEYMVHKYIFNCSPYKPWRHQKLKKKKKLVSLIVVHYIIKKWYSQDGDVNVLRLTFVQ